MEKSVVAVLLTALVSWGFYLNNIERNPPKFCTMPSVWEQVEQEETVALFANPDTLLEHELVLLSDSNGEPLLFYADIMTPVCIDNVCKPVHIELYWNLVGEYVGYGIFEKQPLTKFDHDEFTEADYHKLHQLLADENSVLRRKKLSDLFDAAAKPTDKIEYKGVEIDAVSGATKKEIKASVIEGALYSCFTLWHLVHDQVPDEIMRQLATVYDTKTQAYFLNAEYEDYQFYAIKHLKPEEFQPLLPRLAAIFTTASPLTRTFLLKKMPDAIWQSENNCQSFYAHFESVDISSGTLLIDKLPQAHPIAMSLLSTQITAMTKNQLKAYLNYLLADTTRLTTVIRRNLEKATVSNDYAYGYLISQYLE